MYSKPVAPLPIGAVLDDGFSLYRHSIKRAFPFAFASAVAASIVNRSMTDASVAGDGGALWLEAACMLLASGVSLFLLVPVIATIKAVHDGHALRAADALRLAAQRFLPVLGVAVLYSSMLFVGALLLLVAPGVWTLVLSVVAVPAAVWALVTFVFALPVVCVERKGVLESLRYSFDLVKGRWWRTAAALTVGALVLYVFMGSAVGAVIAFQGDSLVVDGQVRFPWYVDAIILPMATAALMPLLYALLVALYADAKLRHEGEDIAARIAALET